MDKETQDLIWIAEIAVFQDTGLFEHEYTQKERDILVEYYNKFFLMGYSRAMKFVFPETNQMERQT